MKPMENPPAGSSLLRNTFGKIDVSSMQLKLMLADLHSVNELSIKSAALNQLM